MNAWKTLSATPLIAGSKWLKVEDRTVETPDGQVIEHWPWVTTPDYINVLAETEDGHFLVFRQGKYGFVGESYAPVGGYLEPGETPLVAAQRELREETGYEAAEWRHLGHFQVDPNRGVAWGDLYLARHARKVTERNADDLEAQELHLLDKTELLRSLREGRYVVLAWAAVVALALMSDD